MCSYSETIVNVDVWAQTHANINDTFAGSVVLANQNDAFYSVIAGSLALASRNGVSFQNSLVSWSWPISVEVFYAK